MRRFLPADSNARVLCALSLVAGLTAVGCSERRAPVEPGGPSVSLGVNRGSNENMRGPMNATIVGSHVDLADAFRISLTGDYVAAGVGMRNMGSGTISIPTLPSGSTIKKAFLYWSVMDNASSDALTKGTFNNNPITGSLIGTAAPPCWTATQIFNFRAEVTSLAQSGENTLAGFASGLTDGSNPWTSIPTLPLFEGASLVVIFSHPGSPGKVIIIREGAVTTVGPPRIETTFSGFTTGASPLATTTFIVADGQHTLSGLDDNPGFNNRIFVGATEIANHTLKGDGPGTQLWDTKESDISSNVLSGATSVTVGIESNTDNSSPPYDCLTWVAQVLSVSVQSTVVPAEQPATVTVTEGGKPVAGVDIPAGTFIQDVTVTVHFVDLAAGQRCHDFLLGQIGRCLEITAVDPTTGGKATLRNPVTVGLCLDVARPLDVFKFEDRQGNVVALEQTAAAFLDCSGFTFGSAESSSPLNRFATRLWRWLEPKPLMAAHTGFGGIVPGPKLSFFTWAEPIQTSFAGLSVNVRRSGKDAFAVGGTFNMGAKDFPPNQGEQGFVPADHDVTLGFGKYFQTIPGRSFKPRSGRFVYTAPPGTTTGVLAMEIRSDGGFTTSGAVVTEGGTLPAFRPFSLQIGHRTQGAGLKCGSDGKCVRQH